MSAVAAALPRAAQHTARLVVGRLAATFVVLFTINATVFMPSTVEAPWRQVVLPFYGIAMMLCGLAAGIVGLIAVIRRRERSWLVWLTLLPGLFVLVFVLGEFLVPH